MTCRGKAILTQAFPECMIFYFPRQRLRDRTQDHAFLDRELAQVVRNAEQGRRPLDNLVRVATRAGQERRVFIPIEIQEQYCTDFAGPLFVYNRRLLDRVRRLIATLAVLADGSVSQKTAGVPVPDLRLPGGRLLPNR
jgi:hypothetical protein